MMEKPNISFFAMCFILLFAAIGLILAVFDLHRLAFVFELMLLLTFIFLLAFAMFMAYHNKKFGWTLIGATLAALLADTFFIVILTGSFETAHATTIFFSFIGLVVALLNFRGAAQESEAAEAEGYEKAKEYYPYIDKMEPGHEAAESKEELKQEIKSELKTELEKSKDGIKESKLAAAKKIKPQFVGSAETKMFHSSKCGWSRLMKRKNKIYFNSRRKAESAGFKAHECV